MKKAVLSLFLLLIFPLAACAEVDNVENYNDSPILEDEEEINEQDDFEIAPPPPKGRNYSKMGAMAYHLRIMENAKKNLDKNKFFFQKTVDRELNLLRKTN